MFQAIEDFLKTRKEDKEKKLKASLLDEEKEDELSKFKVQNWIPNAAKRASQLSLVSHPAKFSHPDAKSNIIFVNKELKKNGYLHSGNTLASEDVVGNAASLDVLKFLKLNAQDNKTILEHLEQETEEIKQYLASKIPNLDFEELRENFLQIKSSGQKEQTDEKIKQIYFLVDKNLDNDYPQKYHLLSVLQPSGLVFALKNRIDQMHFSDEAKQAKEDKRNNKENPNGFSEIYNLTQIGFGGSKPQNISDLNSKNGGKAYLLPSIPPSLSKEYIKLPKKDFFSECIFYKDFATDFKYWNKLLQDSRHNEQIRSSRDSIIYKIAAKMIIVKAELIRSKNPENWSDNEKYKNLPKYQQVWLDNAYHKDRKDEEGWLDKVINNMAKTITHAFNKINKASDIKQYDVDILDTTKKILKEFKEDLR